MLKWCTRTQVAGKLVSTLTGRSPYEPRPVGWVPLFYCFASAVPFVPGTPLGPLHDLKELLRADQARGFRLVRQIVGRKLPGLCPGLCIRFAHPSPPLYGYPTLTAPYAADVEFVS